MDVKAARPAPERFDRSIHFQRGGGQPYMKKVCKYWLAGTCNREPCAFVHSNMPHSQPLREPNQAPCNYSKQTSFNIKRNFNHISSTNVPSPTGNIGGKNTWRNPESTSFKHATVSTNRVMASEVDRDQGIPKKIPATFPSNGVVGSNVERYKSIVKNIHATVASNKAPGSKIDTNQRVPMNMGTTAASNGLVGSEGDTYPGLPNKILQNKILNTKGSGLPSSNAVSLNSPTKGGTQCENGQSFHKPQSKLCTYWVTGNCVQGDKCKDLHSWFCGSGFSMMTKLEGHIEEDDYAISGVVLPSGSDKLFSASKDETLLVWDCHSGQCVTNVKVEGEIQCLLSEGEWLFAGLRNAVKAWNFQTQSEHVLNGPNGLVHALAASDDLLFAGVQGGSILVWKSNFGPDCPEPKATLKGHNLTVLTLVVGAKRLFSGSKDSTICVWNLESLQCVEIVTGHTDFVTSLLCWDRFLLSGSLDNTVKVWAASESGKLNVEYEVKEESGIIILRGIMDAANKPILLCSCKDSTVRLYDLPSFVERGRIFGKKEIQTIEIGWCGGHFFTGDATGQLSVWRLDGEFKAASS